MTSTERIEALETAVAELERGLGEASSRLQGIHTNARFTQMHPHLIGYSLKVRAEHQAVREAAEAAKPKPTVDLKARYRPVTSALLAERERGD